MCSRIRWRVALSSTLRHINHWLRWFSLHGFANIHLALHLQFLFWILARQLHILIAMVVNVVWLIHYRLVIFTLDLHTVSFMMSWVNCRIKYLIRVNQLWIAICSMVLLDSSSIFPLLHFFFIFVGHATNSCALRSIIIHHSLLILSIFD